MRVYKYKNKTIEERPTAKKDILYGIDESKFRQMTFEEKLKTELMFLFDHSVSNTYGGWLDESVADIKNLVLETVGEVLNAKVLLNEVHIVDNVLKEAKEKESKDYAGWIVMDLKQELFKELKAKILGKID